jgi:23S rRNA pseudouridine1911/1915/1917 synthase
VAWQPQDLPLELVYEDADILVIDKPAGLVVHPGAGNPVGTLANAILYHFPELAALPRAGLVHRIDKDTTGLLVVARNEHARSELIRALECHTVSRCYLAVVDGIPISGGTVDQPIGRHPRNRLRMAVSPVGKPAVTRYRVEEKFRAHALISVELETGRTHQIRVHLSWAGYPLVGDALYGRRLRIPAGASNKFAETLRGFKRQALHARSLTLAHPRTGESLDWKSPEPPDLAQLLSTLRSEQ